MGGYDALLAGKVEPFLRDHSERAKILMVILESGHLTVSGGQFDWGGRLNFRGVYIARCKIQFSCMLEYPIFCKNLVFATRTISREVYNLYNPSTTKR